ncbi:pyruvate decarboxylase [Dacryopinax primogenitus]|uniref:Pyruvate decarboxylase n=1 Tax=Dacryopinax primogenitus (strain DJM 731) TaxID=1858805 RepID=M5FWT0_DACPD|nr:pyruvate decarboxylase [Dacryopinax primogenitus]EJU00145.1 pyruvate decarboxylase [Dacryopinax primogenitus]
MASVQNGQVELGDYLIERLIQLGVKQVFGVPGDFNMPFLDLIQDHADIGYIGCCNELNAGYAADGYARVTGKVGAVVTTFGVGELSATNAIAGAHSERVPVVHIVGVPATTLQAHQAILHHTLGDSKFDAFIHIAQHITGSNAIIMKAEHAAEQIDMCLSTMLLKARPSYITIPTDLVHAKISAKPLSNLLKPIVEHPSKEATENFLAERICAGFENAERPVVLIDACTLRFHVVEAALRLINKTGVTFFTSPMGKAAISETHPNFGGVYVGDISLPSVREAFESADFVLAIGTMKSDFNSGSFTWRMPGERTVELHSDHVVFQYGRFEGVTFQTILPLLVEKVHPLKPSQRIPHDPFPNLLTAPLKGKITQEGLWPLVSTAFKDNDVIIGETGTSAFGVLETRMPAGAIFGAQILWGSIGWAGGAVLGAAVAAEESPVPRRTILFTGDGSWQLTVQELSTMARINVKPIIFVLNNDGYTIERFIHGPNRTYNDIQPWKWTQLLSVFGAAEGSYATYQVKTFEELSALLKDPKFAAAEKLQIVELFIGKMDAPRALRLQAEATAKVNA